MRRNGQTATFSAASITTKARRLPNRVILHAKAGWGKTSFAAQIPGVVFLMVGDETGLLTLIDNGQLPENIAHFPNPAETKGEILQAIRSLELEEHPHKVLAIDSITTVEQLLHKKVCREKFEDDWGERGFTGYDRGPKAAAPEWEEIIAALDRLRQKGIGCMLLAHSRVSNFRNPDGADFERWTAALSKYSWDRLFSWADMVLFGSFEVQVATAKVKDTKGKASGGQDRVILTEWRAAYDAKHRHGLPCEIECGDSPEQAWANYLTALRQK